MGYLGTKPSESSEVRSITLEELSKKYGVELTESDLIDTHPKYGSIATRYIGIRHSHSYQLQFRLLVQSQEAKETERVYYILKTL